MVALTDVKDVIAHTGNVIKIFGGNPVSMSPESEVCHKARAALRST
jgi:hypothetical protein